MTGLDLAGNIKAEGAKRRGFDTYSECVDQVLSGTVDAMITDGAILLGYAAEHPDDLKVVVEPFSKERDGVGDKQGQARDVPVINDTLNRPRTTARWAKRSRRPSASRAWTTPEAAATDECPAPDAYTRFHLIEMVGGRRRRRHRERGAVVHGCGVRTSTTT